ncbi:Transglycosylase SLT domain-containing protein [Granulicella pectinivorans]|uniref:Transglycosylase SLT domain-containing protein n=1 Tax=Granulicella pectinivorans TaxID=474950 RepID=A0A1I6N081_9BACT|nr:Transglycosylase SLT domain-containing protein [Granulicella pectinivorans]
MVIRRIPILGILLALAPVGALAAEHVTLTNGFSVDCVKHEALGESGMVRLFPLSASDSTYMDVPAGAVKSVEPLMEIPVVAAPSSSLETHLADAKCGAPGSAACPRTDSVKGLLVEAGAKHHIDVDLLAAVVKAESGGQVRAVSRVRAQGLMQLMPGTAAGLGVKDAFKPEENIAGGTEYLDRLLTRYHDDVALALAAYNAGPGAVDRWHGVPPYRETRAYVTRIINEFNRRKMALRTAVR